MADQSSASPIAAVILAAGMSERMGSSKAFLDLDGRPLLCRLIDTVHQVKSIGQIFIVTGFEPQRIQQAVGGDRAITLVHNDAFKTGEMLSSVKVGATSVQGRCDAFFLMLLDQPLVRADTLATLIDVWGRQQPHPAMVIPTHSGRRGHPILIDGRGIPSIASLPQSATLRDVVKQYSQQSVQVEVSDPGVLTDVDTPHDYQLVLGLWRTMRSPTA